MARPARAEARAAEAAGQAEHGCGRNARHEAAVTMNADLMTFMKAAASIT
jgi:hypothetical protein